VSSHGLLGAVAPRARSYVHDRIRSRFRCYSFFLWVVGERQPYPAVDLCFVCRVGAFDARMMPPISVTRAMISSLVMRRCLAGFFSRVSASARLAWVSFIQPVTSTGSAPASSAARCWRSLASQSAISCCAPSSGSGSSGWTASSARPSSAAAWRRSQPDQLRRCSRGLAQRHHRPVPLCGRRPRRVGPRPVASAEPRSWRLGRDAS
jgi:hypothetical protein